MGVTVTIAVTKARKILLIALAALVISLAMSIVFDIKISYAIRSNCRDIQNSNLTLSNIAQTQLNAITSGKRDEDIKRVYGTDPTVYKGKTYPRWIAVKQEAIDEGKKRVRLLAPKSCALKLFPWEW